MPVYVRRQAPGCIPLDSRKLRRAAQRMVESLELKGVELSVLLCDDALIRQLNQSYRKQDRATDVLAFPQSEQGLGKDAAGRLLGDIAISLDTAQRQAVSRRRPLFDEVRFLLAHGLLHLLGYDHGTPEEKQEMTRLTRRLVRSASRESARSKKKYRHR